MKKSKKTRLIVFVKTRRKLLGMTQVQLAKRAGVGLRFVRDLEQGTKDLRMDKVNDVLALFGHELGPVRSGEAAMSEQDASVAGE
jgi:y4mF family transcriptional regulator